MREIELHSFQWFERSFQKQRSKDADRLDTPEWAKSAAIEIIKLHNITDPDSPAEIANILTGLNGVKPGAITILEMTAKEWGITLLQEQTENIAQQYYKNRSGQISERQARALTGTTDDLDSYSYIKERLTRIIPFRDLNTNEPVYTMVHEWFNADGKVVKDNRFFMNQKEFEGLLNSCEMAALANHCANPKGKSPCVCTGCCEEADGYVFCCCTVCAESGTRFRSSFWAERSQGE